MLILPAVIVSVPLFGSRFLAQKRAFYESPEVKPRSRVFFVGLVGGVGMDDDRDEPLPRLFTRRTGEEASPAFLVPVRCRLTIRASLVP
jgi:hypothetical protein